MKYKSLILKLYKPLMNNNLSTVIIQDMTLINILSAPNGWGKSSILRQMNPWPAVRTDYLKGGKKTLVLEHNGVEYTLISDFDNTNHTHSFLKDGQEFNLSGNTDVQISLVKQYFGYNLIIDKILSGKFKFCDMTKSQRKELLYATYPFQLDFVLEKYKDLMSKIKAGNAQLKLLSERKLKLSGEMLKPETKEEYEKQAKELTDILHELDKRLYEYEQSIKRSKSQLDLIRVRIPAGMETEDYKSKAELISAKMRKLYANQKNLILDGSTVHDATIREISEMSNIHKKMNDLQMSGTSLKEEIEKYRAAANDDTEEQIKLCSSLIEAQKTIIRDNPFESALPIVTEDELERLEQALPFITKDLLYLKSLSCEMWTESKYESVLAQLKNLEFQIAQENSFVARGEALLVELKRKYDKNNQYSFPPDCKRGCHLRENLENILDSIMSDIKKCKTDVDATSTLLKSHKEEYEALKSEYQGRSTARPILLRMERSITSKSWGDFVLDNVTLVEAVNKDITSINNRLAKLVANTKALLTVKKAKEVLVGLEAKLTGLKSSTKPMKEMITKVMVEKEVQLSKVNDQITACKQELSSLEDVHSIHAQHERLITEINQLAEDFSWYKQGVMLKTEIEYTERIMSDITRDKNQIGTKLRELEGILKEQEGYNIRLKDEILPSIEKIEVQIKKYQLIADEICPTSGLPCSSIMKYANAILHKANQYIRAIWSFDMELSYFSEEECQSFDFTFPILLNNTSKVPDISLASKGQSSVINLAITLAMASYLKMSSQYPIILDEILEGLSVQHVQTATDLLGKYLHEEAIQSYIVSHDAITNANFVDASYITLCDDDSLPATAKVISKVVTG